MRSTGSSLVSIAVLVLLLGLVLATPTQAQSGPFPTAGVFHAYVPLIEVATFQDIVEQQVVDLTNQFRVAAACPPFRVSVQLAQAARAHSQEMADFNYFSHTDRQGHDPAWRAQNAGYTGNAGWENIAAGYPTAEEVVTAWFNSDGHRRNMLDCTLLDIGVGYGENNSSHYIRYWTQDFGRP